MSANPLLDLLNTGAEYTFSPDYQYELISEESGNKLFIKGKSILLKLASEKKPREIERNICIGFHLLMDSISNCSQN